MLRRVLLGLICLLPIPLSAAMLYAQEPTVTLVGSVLDSSTATPLTDVAIYIDHATPSQLTDSAGSFRLAALERGPHILVFMKSGYAPKTFRLVVPEGNALEEDVGPVFLPPIPAVSISGIVNDSMTGLPVFLAEVSMNGERVVVTGVDGAFAIQAAQLRWGANRLEFRRMGYAPKAVLLGAPTHEVDITTEVELAPLAVAMPEVVVEGDRTVYVYGRLREFEYRRKSGLGYYFTRADIERLQPLYVSDLLWRVPGVMVSPSSSGTNNVRFLRGGGCTPAFFLDGMPLNPVAGLETNIDDMVLPDEVAGIEVYKGPATVPGRFGMLGSCGIVAVWTRYR